MVDRIKIYTPQDGFQADDLLHYGLDHLLAAEHLFQGSPNYLDSAGYLAHLGLELLLKGWHLYIFGRFKGIHKLQDLYNELKAADANTTLSQYHEETLSDLDVYTELRYPRRRDPVEIGPENWQRIQDLVDAFFEKMPKELNAKVYKLSPTKKGGRVLMERPIPNSDDT